MGRDDILMDLKEKVKIGNCALLVIDVQNDFCADDGWYSKNNDLTMIHTMVPGLNRLVQTARERGVLTVLIKTIYNEHVISNVMKEKLIKRGLDLAYCLEDTWGADFYIIEPKEGDVILIKERHSAFFRTELDTLLRHHGIKTVILTGVATNVCVDCTAREAFAMDYYVVMPSDCTATFSAQLQELTLQNIERVFGTVCTSDEIMAAWENE